MLSWMFENKVSEYQQYQDALAEDEFFDEDQVSCWWKLENYQMFSHHQSLPCLTVKEEENTESYLFYNPWFRARRGWTDQKRTDYHLTDSPRTTSLLFRQIKISFFSKCSCSSINQKIFSSLESLVWEKMQMQAYCTLHIEYCILHIAYWILHIAHCICTMQDRETDAPMQSIMRWQRRRASLRFYLFSWYCRAKEHLLCLQISFKWRERCFDSIFYSVMASCCISSTADFLWNIEIWKIILITLEALEDFWNVKIGKMKPTVSHRY